MKDPHRCCRIPFSTHAGKMQKRKRDIFHRRRQKGYVEGENQTPLVAMLFFCSYCLKKKKVATCNVKFGPLLSDVGLSSETLT